MNCYLDSSIVLAALLDQGGQFDRWAKIENAISSVLLKVECQRVLDRCRLDGKISDHELGTLKNNLGTFLKGITLCSIDINVVERASAPFSTIVGTLDAMHLSTAMLWQESRKQALKFLTYDKQLKTAAMACGLSVDVA